MIFAVHLKVKMAGKEKRAKELLDKFLTADIGIKAVHDFKEPIQYITETKATVRCKSKIPGYIFIEIAEDFVPNSRMYLHDMPAETWHFLKDKLSAFNIHILDYKIPAKELQMYFELEELLDENIMEETAVVISIDKEDEEIIVMAEELEEDKHHTKENKFIDVFCVAVTKAKSLLSTKEGRTRLNISRRLWKEAYSLFDPFRMKNKESFIGNHTYLPYLIRAIEGSV